MKTTTREKLLCLCECAVLLALSCVLSFIVIYKMPMGGSVTLVSMVPVLIVGYRHGFKAGLSTAFLYSMFQLFQGIAGGDVFPHCYTIFTTVACALFDYVVPFTLLALTFIARGRSKLFCELTVGGIMVLRFLCHFFSDIFRNRFSCFSSLFFSASSLSISFSASTSSSRGMYIVAPAS